MRFITETAAKAMYKQMILLLFDQVVLIILSHVISRKKNCMHYKIMEFIHIFFFY